MSHTFMFFPEGAFGPTNNCVGIGNVLRARGHEVVFVIEDFVAATSPVFRKPTIEALDGFIEPTFRALCDGARYVDDQLRSTIDDVGPDVIIEDNVVSFPAILASGRPWVRIMSCNPLEVPDPDLPPVFSGYSTTNRVDWAAYRDRAETVLGPLHSEFDEFCRVSGASALPAGEFQHTSDWLNLALYPAELDYRRSNRLPASWHTIEANVRDNEPAWQPPAGDDPLIYLSLGSLGSADLPLMRQLVDALTDTPYRVVVSKGPRHDELDLADGMVGAEFLPQTSVLPHVDVVITHGGNNTVTESMYFGKPMVVLPLFWDQHDNAQRIDETGFGVRLPTYHVGRDDLVGAIERLLADQALQRTLAATSRRLQASPGTIRSADRLETLARTKEPVLT